MGGLIMWAVSGLAAAAAIGWIGSNSWPPEVAPKRGTPSARGFAIVSMAFCEGVGVLGAVVAYLTIFDDGPVTPVDTALAGSLPIVGAVIGFLLLLRSRRSADRAVLVQAASFVLGLGALAVSVAILASMMGSPHPAKETWLYSILSVGMLIPPIVIARRTGATLQKLQGRDADSTLSIYRTQMARTFVVQLLALASAGVAIWMIVAN